MKKGHKRIDPRSVFLNVPFDSKYGPLFIALIAGLTALGRKPHSVLEVASSGPSRLDRLFSLISSCGASLHDLSRVGLSGPLRVPRFNMPFELGLSYTLYLRQTHRVFVFEERPYRLQASLSDLNGNDPHIHSGTQQGILRCVLDCFADPKKSPPLSTLNAHTRRLAEVVKRLQRDQGVDSPFHPFLFRQITDAATELARLEGLIR